MKKEILLEQIRSLGIRPHYELSLPVKHIGPHHIYLGMEFTIPKNPEIYSDPQGFNEFILIEDQHGNWMQFYPSTFCKVVALCDENGDFIGDFAHAEGTVVDVVQNYSMMKDAINALKGKKLRVTKMKLVRTRRNGGLAITYVPTIDFVD